MAARENSRKQVKEGKGALIICFVLFTTFFINVLFGKANISFGMTLPHLGNVAEFLLLFVASISLIVEALKAEAAEK
jgi:hypothetical protein